MKMHPNSVSVYLNIKDYVVFTKLQSMLLVTEWNKTLYVSTYGNVIVIRRQAPLQTDNNNVAIVCTRYDPTRAVGFLCKG